MKDTERIKKVNEKDAGNNRKKTDYKNSNMDREGKEIGFVRNNINHDREKISHGKGKSVEREALYVRESQPAYMPRRYTVQDYYALPEERRVELINGVFYDMSAPSVMHQLIIGRFMFQFSNYIDRNKGKCMLLHAPVDVQLDRDDYTMVQPDLLVLCDKSKNADRCIMGAPDLVIEVLSSSTKTKDKGIKFYKYRDAGVREYWIVDLQKETVIVHYFEKNEGWKEYTVEDEIPVGIYNGDLKICMEKIFSKIS